MTTNNHGVISLDKPTFFRPGVRLILSLLLFITSQSLIISYLKHWPLFAIFGLLVITGASILIAAKFITNEETDNKAYIEHLYTKNIPFNTDGKMSIKQLLLAVSIIFASSYIVNLLSPTKKVYSNTSKIIGGYTSGDGRVLNLALYIVIFAVIIPIVEELLYRELLPNIIAKKWMYILVGVVFVLLHQPNSINMLANISILTAILTYAKLTNGLVQSTLTHITWNTISCIMMLL